MGLRTGTSNPKRVTLLALALRTWISGPGFQDLHARTHAPPPPLRQQLPTSLGRSLFLSLSRSGPGSQDLGFRTWISAREFCHRTAYRNRVQFCRGACVWASQKEATGGREGGKGGPNWNEGHGCASSYSQKCFPLWWAPRICLPVRASWSFEGETSLMTVESSATLALDITAPMQCLSTNLLAASTSRSSGILLLLLLFLRPRALATLLESTTQHKSKP